eukprot:169018-Chlamydomonas_euryale.AAC.1
MASPGPGSCQCRAPKSRPASSQEAADTSRKAASPHPGSCRPVVSMVSQPSPHGSCRHFIKLTPKARLAPRYNILTSTS